LLENAQTLPNLLHIVSVTDHFMLTEFWQNYSANLLTLLLGALAIAAILAPALWQRRRRRQLAGQAVPRHWRSFLRHHWPQYRQLPAPLQQRLGKQMQRFLAETEIIGCAGLQLTEPMKLLIAAQACLLTVQLPVHDYPGLRQILVYPDAFRVQQQHTDAAGVVSQTPQWREGESWQQGKVVLSWQHTLQGAAEPADGRNLVFHEFAHQLDGHSGTVNGMPLLPAGLHSSWSTQMQVAFDQLQQRIAKGMPLWIDPYAATNPAEFFAVLTEMFFEQPQHLFAQQAGLYQLLAEFYRLDPRQWSLQQLQLPVQNGFSRHQ